MTVYEMTADIDEASLAKTPAAWASYPEVSFQLFTPAAGGLALLARDPRSGTGAVTLLRDGVKYNVMGPSLPAATARMLAEKL